MEDSGREALKTLGVLLALLLASATALAQATFAQLSGEWVVVGLQLRPSRVYALRIDDPKYMGPVLEATNNRLTWPYRPTGGELEDACIRPRWDGSLVACAAGGFGPPGATLTYAGDQLRLEWYDGAILTLQRVK